MTSGGRKEIDDIQPMQQSAFLGEAVAEGGRSPEATVVPPATVCVETDGRSTVEGVVTRLSQGPGWTLEVVRPRVGGVADVGAARVKPAAAGDISDLDPMQQSALPEATAAAGRPGVTAAVADDVGEGRISGVVA
jgi:hypothetical protein